MTIETTVIPSQVTQYTDALAENAVEAIMLAPLQAIQASLESIDSKRITDQVRASEDLLASANTERATLTEQVFTLRKSITISQSGQYRIKFDLGNSSAGVGTITGRIYKNGVAVGTSRAQSSDTYATYTEDISNWTAGDLCQLYTTQSAAATAHKCRNFQIFGVQGFALPVVVTD